MEPTDPMPRRRLHYGLYYPPAAEQPPAYRSMRKGRISPYQQRVRTLRTKEIEFTQKLREMNYQERTRRRSDAPFSFESIFPEQAAANPNLSRQFAKPAAPSRSVSRKPHVRAEVFPADWKGLQSERTARARERSGWIPTSTARERPRPKPGEARRPQERQAYLKETRYADVQLPPARRFTESRVNQLMTDEDYWTSQEHMDWPTRFATENMITKAHEQQQNQRVAHMARIMRMREARIADPERMITRFLAPDEELMRVRHWKTGRAQYVNRRGYQAGGTVN